MELKTVIATILFILPGVLAYNWSEYVSNTTNRNKTNTEKTVMILCFAIPIVSLSLLVLNTWFNYDISGLTSLTKAGDDINFLLSYVLVNVIIAYFVAEIWVLYLRKLINTFVNFNRGSSGLTSRQTLSVWEEAFDNEGTKVAYIAEMSNPSSGQWGILKTISLSEERDREYILIGTEVIENVKYLFTESTNSYIDSKSGMLVRLYEFDPVEVQEEYHKILNKKEE
ncbi:hypothetical protein [Bacillus sp. FJAT-45350]|uniref:hypothetical protein n=1 Tax=Bacillus sp. FJAT-45350 TaxID=2011014 RepID=UPI000BB7BC96|nr:hypothetical protein [Bacillus sp. FJAT-45350]